MKDGELTISNEGAQHFRDVLSRDELVGLKVALETQPRDLAGVRLSGIPALSRLLGPAGPIGHVPAFALGPDCLPVRAILFDKSSDMNWSLGWHQDRTIAVKQRIAVTGFGPWTVKRGLIHVEPPFDLLANMVTVRVHLDDVTTTNAPLLIAPGSHKRGRIPTTEISKVVHECGVIACLAAVGDIWLYATPILHASDSALKPLHRRVLQVDYAREVLPGGLQWLGV